VRISLGTGRLSARLLPAVELVGIALASATAGLLLVTGPLPATHDGLHHLFRLYELDRCLRGGSLFPRLFPDMAFGYGYPVLNYYSPLAYYLAWVWVGLGLGYIGALKATYLLAFALSGLGMYLWARTFLPRPAATLAALAYVVAPYHVADVYVRGALAEALAFVWPPYMLWSAVLLSRRPSGRAACSLALATAALALTHNLSAALFAPAVAAYALALVLGKPNRVRHCLWLALSLLAGVFLAAFHWLPALAEGQYVYASAAAAQAQISPSLQPALQWLSRYIIHRYTPEQGVLGEHPFGLVQALLSLSGALAFLHQWRQRVLSVAARLAFLWAAACTAAVAFLLTPRSLPVWQALPFLRYLQFAWRLQALSSLGTAALAAALVLPLRTRLQWPATALLTVLALVASTAGLRNEPAHLPTRQPPLTEADISLDGLLDYEFQTALWLREHGGIWLLEYLPIWLAPERATFFLPRSGPPGDPALPPVPQGARVAVQRDLPLKLSLTATSPEPFALTLHRFCFPGWRAWVDGRPAPVQCRGEFHLVSVDVPAGEHSIVLAFGSTPVRSMGMAISAMTAALVLAMLVRQRNWGELAALGAALLLFFALVGVRAHLHPIGHKPQPVQATLGEAAALTGWAVESEAGATQVWLYWFALQPSRENLKAFVHAEGQEGELLGQHDSQPGGEFSPTSRWIPGELIPDRHPLSLPSGSQARLYAGLYRFPPLENLPVEQDGVPRPDGRVLLGELTGP
jgi:hypothetical protein